MECHSISELVPGTVEVTLWADLLDVAVYVAFHPTHAQWVKGREKQLARVACEHYCVLETHSLHGQRGVGHCRAER